MIRLPTRSNLAALLGLALLTAACGDSSSGNPSPSTGNVTVKMDFTRTAGFYEAPFPSLELQHENGRVDLSGFPNPTHVAIIEQARRLITRDANGFGLTSGVFFSLTGTIDRSRLPDVDGSLDPDATVFLFSLDDRRRVPVRTDFVVDGGPFGAANLLSLVPYQGVPLRPLTRYAAVVCAELQDEAGQRLRVSPAVEALAAGQTPVGLTAGQADDYTEAYAAAKRRCTVAGLATFTTGDPASAQAAFTEHALSQPLPVPGRFSADEVFDDYCVYSSTIEMPDYQHGIPPYSVSGGDWLVDDNGEPLLARHATANLFVTIPRSPMPEEGYPTMVLVRAGAGGDRPLVDRGVHEVAGGPAAAGSGPAQEFARVGYAGVQVDGPLGGLRNTTHGDEQFLVFNVFNLAVLRDNVRESALELAVLAHALEDLEIDTSACPGAAAVSRIDTTTLGLMGHSTGATIAPLAMAIEPRFRAVVLSGAGGSYIENVLYKRKPIEVLPAALLFLRYGNRALTENDPALNLVQWAVEPSDPPVYADLVIRNPQYRGSPAHVLMLQGIVDNYILPNIANATSLSLGLDLFGPAIDDENQPELAGQTPILSVLPLSGGRPRNYPASCNRRVNGACVTAVLAQHAGDGIEDGHETVFQTEPPKVQYRAFLESLLDGAPTVPE